MTGRMGVPMPGMGAGPSLSKIMFDKYDKVRRRPCPRTTPSLHTRANAGTVDLSIGLYRTMAARLM